MIVPSSRPIRVTPLEHYRKDNAIPGPYLLLSVAPAGLRVFASAIPFNFTGEVSKAEFLWSFGDGKYAGPDANQYYEYKKSGTYLIRCTAFLLKSEEQKTAETAYSHLTLTI